MMMESVETTRLVMETTGLRMMESVRSTRLVMETTGLLMMESTMAPESMTMMESIRPVMETPVSIAALMMMMMMESTT
jgi:hypothetical protein